MTTFMELATRGDIGIDSISDFMEEWQRSTQEQPAVQPPWEFLGMSAFEFRAWSDRPGMLSRIVALNRKRLTRERAENPSHSFHPSQV